MESRAVRRGWNALPARRSIALLGETRTLFLLSDVTLGARLRGIEGAAPARVLCVGILITIVSHVCITFARTQKPESLGRLCLLWCESLQARVMRAGFLQGSRRVIVRTRNSGERREVKGRWKDEEVWARFSFNSCLASSCLSGVSHVTC